MSLTATPGSSLDGCHDVVKQAWDEIFLVGHFFTSKIFWIFLQNVQILKGISTRVIPFFSVKTKNILVWPGAWPPRLPGLAQRPEPGPRGGAADQSEAEDPGLSQSELRAARGHGPGQQQQHHHDIRIRRGQGRAGPRLPSPKCLWRLHASAEQAADPGHHPPAPSRLRWERESESCSVFSPDWLVPV